MIPVTHVEHSYASARLALLVLAFANFVVGMGAFVVIGVLSPVASAFGLDKATAGWILTAYALAYAVSSPVLVSLTGAVDRKHILLTGMGLFLGGTFAAALAPSFPALLAARVVMAIGGGLVTPIAASVGVALVDLNHRARALALVFGGLTLAQALGVPAGAWLGYAFGWHTAFFGVVGLAVIGLAVILAFIPKGIKVPVTTLATLGSVLAQPILVLAVSFTAFFVAGLYTIFTFTAPLLEARLGLSNCFRWRFDEPFVRQIVDFS